VCGNKVRTLVGVSVLSFLLCSDTVGWGQEARRAISLYKPVAIIHKDSAVEQAEEDRQRKNDKSSAVAETGDHMATTDMDRKVGGAAVPLLWGGELGTHLTHCGLGRGIPPYQVAS